jgi:hypothetical protein
MKTRKCLFMLPFAASLFLLLSYIIPASAFEISAYYDPYSLVQANCYRGGFMLGNCDNCVNRFCNFEIWKSSLRNNAQALQWLDAMGLTNLCTYYRYGENYDSLLAGTSFAVMNDYHDNETNRYLEAQHRELIAASGGDYVWPDTVVGSWGVPVFSWPNNITPNIGPSNVLKINPAAGADTLWRPATWFDHWNGWNREGEFVDATHLFGTVMPIHITLTAKVDSTEGDTTNHVATLYWYTRNWWEMGEALMCGDTPTTSWYNAPWVRWPGIPIYKSDFDSFAYQFNACSYLMPPLGNDTLVFCCENFDSLTYRDSLYTYWNGFESRFMITYTGHHTFMLYDVKASDQAYYELFDAPADSLDDYADAIAERFSDIRQSAGARLQTWYSDEPNLWMYKPFARVQRILQDHNLPKFILNGWNYITNVTNPTLNPRAYFFQQLQEQGVTDFPVMMTEFYPFGGDSTMRPIHPGSPSVPSYTRMDSDAPYWNRTYAEICTSSGVPFRRVNGTISLQCALDPVALQDSIAYVFFGEVC